MKAIILAFAVMAIVIVTWFLTRPLLDIEMPKQRVEQALEPSEKTIDVENRLRAAGLHPTGLLSDLGIDDHLQRLSDGAVDTKTLLSYAEAIKKISARSSARGQILPPTLWDVSTPALHNAGWTVYSLTEALASDMGGVHIDLLSDAYGAFLDTRPNALEGALALLPLARSYVEALPEEARAEHEAHAKTNGQAMLLIWQALLTGTTRHNPLTHRPLWSHGYVGHFSVPHIHQYAVGKGMTPAQVWGVEGFDPKFVGPPSNANQVEHLGISALLQGVARVPGSLLSAVEAFEVVVDHENAAAAEADRALNRAVREVLVPRSEAPAEDLVTALRTALARP